MKTFTKTTFIAFILLFGITANAQESAARFGVKAGLNYSGNHGKDVNSNSKIGLNIGVTLDFRLTQEMCLLTGLEYSVKGAKGKEYIDGNRKIQSTDNPAYLQLPLHFGYRFFVSDFILTAHGGPFMAYGIGGKVNIKVKPADGGPTEETKIDFFGVGVGKFDYGVGLGVNGEYRKFVVDLGYDLGLRKAAKEFNEGMTKNGYLTVGYKF